MKITLLAAALLVLHGCQSDPAPAPATAPAPVSASAAPLDCPGLAEHWREVWATETRTGLESRRVYAVRRMLAGWAKACAKVAKTPATEAPPGDVAAAVVELRAARTFTAIHDASRSAGSTSKRLLSLSIEGSALRTRLAYVPDPSGVEECEEAVVDAAFCGDAADQAAVRAAATRKDAGTCAGLSAVLAHKCTP